MRYEKPSLANRVASEVVLDFLLLTSFSFLNRQRKAIVERDRTVGIKIEGNKNGCQFPYKHKCSGKIHVHHWLPEEFQKAMGIPDPDQPYLAISLCDAIHIGKEGQQKGGPHPDQPGYLDEYRKGNKDAFKKMQNDRRDKITEKVPYWNPDHDREYAVLAIRNTQRMEEKKPRWWPKRVPRSLT